MIMLMGREKVTRRGDNDGLMDARIRPISISKPRPPRQTVIKRRQYLVKDEMTLGVDSILYIRRHLSV